MYRYYVVYLLRKMTRDMTYDAVLVTQYESGQLSRQLIIDYRYRHLSLIFYVRNVLYINYRLPHKLEKKICSLL